MFNNFQSLEIFQFFFKNQKRQPAEHVNNSFALHLHTFPIGWIFVCFHLSTFSAFVVLELMVQMNVVRDMPKKEDRESLFVNRFFNTDCSVRDIFPIIKLKYTLTKLANKYIQVLTFYILLYLQGYI